MIVEVSVVNYDYCDYWYQNPSLILTLILTLTRPLDSDPDLYNVSLSYEQEDTSFWALYASEARRAIQKMWMKTYCLIDDGTGIVAGLVTAYGKGNTPQGIRLHVQDAGACDGHHPLKFCRQEGRDSEDGLACEDTPLLP